MGRPPIQHHKHVHVIALSPETEEFLDKALDRVTAHKALRTAGGFFTALASHPAGLAVLASIAAYLGLRFGVGKDLSTSLTAGFWGGIFGLSAEQKADLARLLEKGKEFFPFSLLP